MSVTTRRHTCPAPTARQNAPVGDHILIRFAELASPTTRDLLTISHRTAGALASNEGLRLRCDCVLGAGGGVGYVVEAGKGAQVKPSKDSGDH